MHSCLIMYCIRPVNLSGTDCDTDHWPSLHTCDPASHSCVLPMRCTTVTEPTLKASDGHLSRVHTAQMHWTVIQSFCVASPIL